MIGCGRIVALLSAVIALSSYASAFFWGSSQSSPSQPQYYYHKRLLQGPTLYSVAETDVNQQYPVPTVPVQVPLQAQFTPTGIRNVQLVPCLCPVSQEYPDGGDKATTVDNFYANLPYQPTAQNTNAGQNKK
ncbi:uncharacterized protein LOC109595211 [Aethina tumida]|uniref:uncharacterized protein LOC109595211 n=1 Tax=Aethina tumida TaxID=116153 RepID=UPI00096B49FC|nr:uncharacterized protein LOC109595211 [Aethina tumida]